ISPGDADPRARTHSGPPAPNGRNRQPKSSAGNPSLLLIMTGAPPSARSRGIWRNGVETDGQRRRGGRTWSEGIAEPAGTHPDTDQDPVGVPPSGGIRIPADRLNAALQPRTPAESDPAQPMSPNDHPGRFRPVEPALLLAPQHGAQPH